MNFNFNLNPVKEVLEAYLINEAEYHIQPFGSGLINHTWLVKSDKKKYILQKINEAVFNQPQYIDDNIREIDSLLKSTHPSYLFVSPLPNRKGLTLTRSAGNGYFRLFPFLEGSHTVDVVQTIKQAQEAAAQFGKFTAMLCNLNLAGLKETIPHFHNLDLRYQQFENAAITGDPARIYESQPIIDKLHAFNDIVSTYREMLQNKSFIKRVTHHDTKISNVLFDKNDEGLCVIDYDTIMPGYFISDVGDMMRTYLSPVSEEETDFTKIMIREDFYKAIVDGYLSEMDPFLTQREKKSFFYAGKFMIYMQSLRFITDYLNQDTYYGAKYPGHNLVRAKNQLALLEALLCKQSIFEYYPY